MQEGYLKANIYTANRLYPVADADMVIYKNGNIMAYRKSDKNGVTLPVSISSPDKDLSETPGNSVPFSTVDVTVKAAGFEPVIYKGVQVFAGETSILNVDMIPVADNPNLNKPGEINIRPQNL